MTTLDALFTIKGKVVAITGGGGAIGQATALLLSNAGAAVALLDRNLAAAPEGQRKVHDQGGNAMALRSEERGEGKEGVRTCRCRWSTYRLKKKINEQKLNYEE